MSRAFKMQEEHDHVSTEMSVPSTWKRSFLYRNRLFISQKLQLLRRKKTEDGKLGAMKYKA
jgi:hypothetical protein